MILRKLGVFLLALPLMVIAVPYQNFRSELNFVNLNGDNEWWQKGSFYQIYPRSFKDSDDDGIGDIKGITESLGYLKEIGITAVWLSPIFESPMIDFGYDISNFYKIQPEYGTMEDFEAMIAKAKELGLKIILDFVPNHSSDQNDWFKKSVEKNEIYKDYYIWHPGYPDPKNPKKRLPPSNWVSIFRKSAWEWNEQRQEYYLHQFTVQQPEFNYRNKAVREEMKKVLRFWLSKGIYGFRIDAAPHIFKCTSKENPFPDEPRNSAVIDPDDYAYLIHNCTVDQPETLELLYDWRVLFDEFKENGEDRILMTEAYSPIDIIMKYYGDKGREGAQIPFNFLFIGGLNKGSNADDFVRMINTWMDKMPAGRTPNWVLGNHDTSRVGTRFGIERIDLMNIILHTLPGASFTYQGEEIGMTDVWISWNDTVDPLACNSNPKIYQKFSRDPERTPFQWNDEKNAGFSKGDKLWLPVAPNYKDVNVKKQRTDDKSHLNTFKRLQNLRKTKTLREGNLQVKARDQNVLGIVRSLQGEPTYVTIVNLNAKIETIDLSTFIGLPDSLKYILVGDHSPHKIGDPVSTKNFILAPYEAVILKT